MDDHIQIENVKTSDMSDVKTFTFRDVDSATEKVWDMEDISSESKIYMKHLSSLESDLLQLQLLINDKQAAINSLRDRILESLPSDEDAISIISEEKGSENGRIDNTH